MELYPHQQELVEKLFNALQTKNKVMIQLPTGGGKTIVGSEIIKRAQAQGYEVWFAVHRDHLVKQAAALFDKLGMPYSIIAAKYLPTDRLAKLKIVSVPTWARRHKPIETRILTIVDEAHHYVANSYKLLPGEKIVGLTATPCRTTGLGFSEAFEELIIGPSVSWLIENKFLAPFIYYAPPPKNYDPTKLKVNYGDYVIDDEAKKTIEESSIFGDAVENYLKHAKGKKAICTCASVEHSKIMAKRFRDAGIRAESIDATSQGEFKDYVLEAFAGKDLDIICHYNMVTEGFDVKDCEVVINLRPTMSRVFNTQINGRALRYLPGKTAIVFDHVENWKRFGKPDKHVDWNQFFFAKKRIKEAEDQNQMCLGCFSVIAKTEIICPHCGAKCEEERQIVNQDKQKKIEGLHIDGELVPLGDVDIDNLNGNGVIDKSDQRVEILRQLLPRCERNLSKYQKLSNYLGYKPYMAKLMWLYASEALDRKLETWNQFKVLEFKYKIPPFLTKIFFELYGTRKLNSQQNTPEPQQLNFKGVAQ